MSNYQRQHNYGQQDRGARPEQHSAKISYELADHEGKIPPELYDATAKGIAERFVDGKATVSKHQLRRLYDDVKRIKRRLDNQQASDSESAWEFALPEIKLMKSKIAYVAARASAQDRKATAQYQAFKQFVDQGIDQSNDPKSFNTFVTLFEAVYGFYYELGGSQQR